MANRFPLVINNSTTVVGELQASDNLNLSLSGIYDGAGTGILGQVLKSTGSNGVVWGTVGDVFLTSTQTLTNKTFSSCTFNALSNTLTNIPNNSLVYSTITINGVAIPLGGTVATIDTNTTYSLGTSTPSVNYALIKLTAGGSGGASSEFSIYGLNGITVSKQANGDIQLSPSLQSLTPGNYITGSSYDGLTARTWDINAVVTATASTIVARDSTGSFAGNNIAASQFIKTGGTSSQFLKADGSIDSNTYLTSAPTPGNGTLTLAVSGTGLSGSQTFTANQSGNSTFTVTSNATSANTASTIVARDSSNNFSAGTITAASFVRSGGTSAQFLKADGSIDSNSYLVSAPPEIPSGSVFLLYQANAPTGWTKVTTQDNKALRVVSGTGGGMGGSTAFTSVFTSRTPSGSVSMTNAAVTLSQSQIPSHNHTFAGSYGYDRYNMNYYGWNQTAGTNPSTNSTNSTGGGQSHTHANTASFSGSSMDFAVQYINIILCSKN